MADVTEQLERLVTERACERLLYEYAWLVDSGAAGQVADLFTEDGAWLGADGGGLRGNDEIRQAFSRRQGVTRRQSRHVMTNVRIDHDGGDRAAGTAYLVNYRHDASGDAAARPAPADHPKFVGDYHLTFRRTSDGWRIETLRFDLAFLRQRREPSGGEPEVDRGR
jgi:ketosteroid isomerase-like protein